QRERGLHALELQVPAGGDLERLQPGDGLVVGQHYEIDPTFRVGSRAKASVWRSMDRATVVPRPAKPARQNGARPKRWPGLSCAVPAHAGSHSGSRSDTYAAPASPAAARRSHESSRLILALLPTRAAGSGRIR